MAQKYPGLHDFLLSMPEARKDYKVEWHWHRYLVRNKMFAAITTPDIKYEPHQGRTMIILKCQPELAVSLREAYPDIVPGFYSDKRCWNSVYLDGQISEQMLQELCRRSYDLVTSGFSKKVQKELLASVPVLETPRLRLRRLNQGDFEDICQVLMDPEVMYAWEGAFTREECQDWLDRTLKRYETDGFSHFAILLKTDGAFAGMAGPIRESIEGEARISLGYLLKKSLWGQGYAAEAAQASMEYAFAHLNAPVVTAQIRPENLPSIRVAQRLGMRKAGEVVRRYKELELPHLVFEKRR